MCARVSGKLVWRAKTTTTTRPVSTKPGVTNPLSATTTTTLVGAGRVVEPTQYLLDFDAQMTGAAGDTTEKATYSAKGIPVTRTANKASGAGPVTYSLTISAPICGKTFNAQTTLAVSSDSSLEKSLDPLVNDSQVLVWVKLTHTDTASCGPVTVFGTLTGEMSFVFARSGGTATGNNSFEIDEGGGNWTGTARLTPR